jgi:hypothetical protein
METAIFIRDWVVAGLVLYLGIRYAILQGQERASTQARIAHLKDLSSPTVAQDLREVSQAMETYARKSRELEQKYKQAERDRNTVIGKAEKVWLHGVSTCAFEGEAALMLVYRDLVGRLFEKGKHSEAMEVHRTIFGRVDTLTRLRHIAEKGEQPTFVNTKDMAEDIREGKRLKAQRHRRETS